MPTSMNSIIQLNIKILLFLVGSLFLTGCKKGNSCEGCQTENKPPIAIAGPDQVIRSPLDSILLDGSGSITPVGNITDWFWTKISGPPSVNIVNNSASKTVVKNFTIGVYLFELTVKNTAGISAKDTLQVSVIPSTPNPGSCTTELCAYISSSCSGYWVCVDIPGMQSALYTCNRDFYQAYGASASTQSKVYFAGGHDDFWVYGGSLNRGIEYDPVNHASRCFTLSVPRSFLAGATAGNKILFAGGKEVSGYSNNPVYNVVDIYDEQTLTHTVAYLSEGRSFLASVSTSSKAYFIGGKTQNSYSDKMDVYNSITNSWQVINLPRERGFAGAVVIGDNIYIAGGKNNSGNIKTIDIYNVQSGQWTSIEAPHDHPIASVATVNNKLVVAGGDGANNKSADIYNITTGQWTSVNLVSSRFNMTVSSINNKIIFLGGAYTFSGTSFSNESDAIDIYDDNTGNWSAGTVSPGVGGVMAASVGSQLIYVGFMSASSTITNTIVLMTF